MTRGTKEQRQHATELWASTICPTRKLVFKIEIKTDATVVSTQLGDGKTYSLDIPTDPSDTMLHDIKPQTGQNYGAASSIDIFTLLINDVIRSQR